MWDNFSRCLETVLTGFLMLLRSQNNNGGSPTQPAPAWVAGGSGNGAFQTPGQTSAFVSSGTDSHGVQTVSGNGDQAQSSGGRTLVDLSSVMASLQLLLNQAGGGNSQTAGQFASNSDGSSNQGGAAGSSWFPLSPNFDGSNSQVYTAGYAGGGQPNGLTGTYTSSGRLPRRDPGDSGSSAGGDGHGSDSSVSNGHKSDVVSVGDHGTAVVGFSGESPGGNHGDAGMAMAAAVPSDSRPSYTGGVPQLATDSHAPAGGEQTPHVGDAHSRSLPGKGCGVPNDVTGFDTQIANITGDWFEYMARTPGNFTPNSNVFHTHNALGFTKLLDSGSWALATNSRVSMYVASTTPPSPQCLTIFEQANFSTDGRKSVVAYQPGKALKNFIYTVLFTDYNTVEIIYRCGQANSATGICDVPYFWVNTRVNPRNLSIAAQNFIKTAVDLTLARYCFGVKDLTLTQWTAAPLCSASTPAPDAFTTFVEKLKPTLTFTPT